MFRMTQPLFRSVSTASLLVLTVGWRCSTRRRRPVRRRRRSYPTVTDDVLGHRNAERGEHAYVHHDD